MGSLQGSALSTNMAELVDGSSARREISYVDSLPVYVMELIAGGAAGAFEKTTIVPLEQTKILLQTRTEGFQSLGVYQSLKKLLKQEGILGFYKGNGASVLRIVPYAALHFMIYEQYRVWIINNYSALGSGPTLTGILAYAGLKFYIYEELKRRVPEEHQKSIVMRLSCRALAGLFGQTFTYPLDVVGRQMQVENMKPLSQGDVRDKNRFEGLSRIFRNQGWRQLSAGLSINYIKIVPSVAIGFTAYDMMKVWLRIPPRQKSQSIST